MDTGSDLWQLIDVGVRPAVTSALELRATSRRHERFAIRGGNSVGQPDLTRVLAAVILVAVLASCNVIHPLARAQAPGPDQIAATVDVGRTFQRIDGFGVNANARSWNNGQLAPALDQLVDGMGAQVFRVILEKSDWQMEPDGADLTTFNWDYYTPIYESPKFQNLWGTLGYLNARHVPLVMLNLMGTIPEWMGGSTLRPDQEDQWVKMVASLVYYGRNTRHVQFNLLSPMNEEDLGAPEGPRVEPEQYARVLAKLSTRLQQLGLDDVKLVGPDTAAPGPAATAYAPLLFADPALMSHVAYLTLHSYSADTGPMSATLAQSAYADRTFWVTEWSSWCQGCDNGRPVAAEWGFATATTDLLLSHLEHGASAAIVYEGYDSYYDHHNAFSYWGQLAFDDQSRTYTPRKRLFTNAQVFRFVRPGMVRVSATSSDPDVHLVAFRDPASDSFTLVGINPHSSGTTLNVALPGLSNLTTLHLVETTQTLDLALQADVALRDGELSVTLSPDSVFTLTSLDAGAGSSLGSIAPTSR